MQDDLTTLVCLFHHRDQASAATNDLLQAGIPESSLSSIEGNVGENEKDELASFDMPDKDYDHLKAGLRDGGIVVAVNSVASYVDQIERIFEKHSARKIDEADRTGNREAYPIAAPLAAAPLAAAPLASGETAIPIVEEELLVGKRTVDQGGVRVYRRIVEIPVDESVTLREEHVNVDRRAVDRPASDQDFAFAGRTIELTETAEEAVVGKEARVVEEVLVGKTASEHTETVADTVRRTEVEIEELPATETTTPRQTY